MITAGFLVLYVVMRLIILLLFVSAFAITPVYLFNTYVMPQMLGLQRTYTHLDDTSAKIMHNVDMLQSK